MSDNLPAEVPNLPVQQQAMQILYDIVQASRDPTVDAGKTTALANLAMQMQDREAERRFRMAKHKALLAMPTITKAGAILNKNGGVQSRYSKWEDIDRVTRPILSENNLILSFNIGHEGQMVTVQPVLAYSDGELAYEERGDHMVLAVDTTGSKNATQGAGSAASYGKRHSAKAILNIIEEGEDTDGKAIASYDSLPDDLKALIDAARLTAKDGLEAYTAYFKGLNAEDRGFLAFNRTESGDTWHEQNKRAAAIFDGGENQ
jgi:ERF superfamily